MTLKVTQDRYWVNCEFVDSQQRYLSSDAVDQNEAKLLLRTNVDGDERNDRDNGSDSDSDNDNNNGSDNDSDSTESNSLAA